MLIVDRRGEPVQQLDLGENVVNLHFPLVRAKLYSLLVHYADEGAHAVVFRREGEVYDTMEFDNYDLRTKHGQDDFQMDFNESMDDLAPPPASQERPRYYRNRQRLQRR